MSNKSVSDFVAASMDAVLKSEAHKALFGNQYKFASDENDAKKCPKCRSSDSCSCGDSAMADTNNDESIDWATKQNLPGDPLAGLNKGVPVAKPGAGPAGAASPWKPFSDLGTGGPGSTPG